MGIHKFSAVFTPTRVTLAAARGERIAIDAYHEYYRASLGIKNIESLTDADGNRTAYLQIILHTILEFQKYDIDQIWIFDNGAHRKKSHAMKARGQRRRRAEETIAAIDEQIATHKKPAVVKQDDIEEEPIDIEPLTEEDHKQAAQIAALVEERQRQEKRAFRVVPLEIERMKHMLDLLRIKWIDAPQGIEAEQLAAQLSNEDYVHAVYSGDTDPIAFGAKKQYRRVKKDLFQYTRAEIRRQISAASSIPIDRIGLPEIRKICVMLGSDFAPKTVGIGERRILKEFSTAELRDDQKEAIEIFELRANLDDIFIHNRDDRSCLPAAITNCIEWLVVLRFNKQRLERMFRGTKPGPAPEIEDATG